MKSVSPHLITKLGPIVAVRIRHYWHMHGIGVWFTKSYPDAMTSAILCIYNSCNSIELMHDKYCDQCDTKCTRKALLRNAVWVLCMVPIEKWNSIWSSIFHAISHIETRVGDDETYYPLYISLLSSPFSSTYHSSPSNNVIRQLQWNSVR